MTVNGVKEILMKRKVTMTRLFKSVVPKPAKKEKQAKIDVQKPKRQKFVEKMKPMAKLFYGSR